MSADARDLERFATDLGRVGSKAVREAEKVVFKGAMNVKRGMAQELRASTHFRPIARSVDFDFKSSRDGIEAEIGPKHGPGEPGNLANIAYFGTSRGGGTVDFMKPFNNEVPRFEKAIADVIRDVL